MTPQATQFRSLLRNKIQFTRACVRVDISEPLLEYAKVNRVVIPLLILYGMKTFLVVVLSVVVKSM